MKRTLFLLCASALIGVFCTGFTDLNAQAPAWDYPVKPGMPEWAEFETTYEMIAACQVPEDVLRSLSTKDLVEVCLNYPMFSDMYESNSWTRGFRQRVVREFNGVQELFRRKDNVQYLLDRLKANDLLELSTGVLNPREISSILFKQPFAEAMLAHESVLANASARQLKEIAVHAMRNMAIKEHKFPLYDWFFLEASAYLLCATLTAMNGGAALSPGLGQFLEKGTLGFNSETFTQLKHFYIKF